MVEQSKGVDKVEALGVRASGPALEDREAPAPDRKCLWCGKVSSTVALKCESCEGPLATVELPRAGAADSRVGQNQGNPPSTRTLYIVIALVLGSVGVHNFYAHRNRQGAWQASLTVLACILSAVGTVNVNAAALIASALVLVTVFVWVVRDIVTVFYDGVGRPLA